MDFTREPIIETIITPKDGCKLVIRSSKNTGQEEYLVDAVEVISFGHAFFFRSLERPKAFLAPISDFEVVEVKEARMVLKNISQDRAIKIGGGRDGQIKGSVKESEKSINVSIDESKTDSENGSKDSEKTETESAQEIRLDKKRDRRRNYKKRRGQENIETTVEEKNSEPAASISEDQEQVPVENQEEQSAPLERTSTLPLSVLSSLLQPPPTLISETINQYRQNDMFKTAFFLSDDEQYKPHDKVEDLLNEEDHFDSSNFQHDSAPEESNEETIQPVFELQNDELIETDESMLKLDTEAALPLFEEEEKVHENNLFYSHEKIDVESQSPVNMGVIEEFEREKDENQKELLENELKEDQKNIDKHEEEGKSYFSPEN